VVALITWSNANACVEIAGRHQADGREKSFIVPAKRPSLVGQSGMPSMLLLHMILYYLASCYVY
jgi:hypothetical protein